MYYKRRLNNFSNYTFLLMVVFLISLMPFAYADIFDPLAISSIKNNGVDINGDAFDMLDGVNFLSIVEIDTKTYAVVVSFDGDGIQIINITDPENPLATSSIKHNDVDINNDTFDMLDTPIMINTVQINSNTYVFVSALVSNGIQIINITDPENPLATHSITESDDYFTNIDNIRGMSNVYINSTLYIIVPDTGENTIQIIDFSNLQNPFTVSKITQNDTDKNGDSFNGLDGPYGITTVHIDTQTYALVTSMRSDTLDIINITDPENPLATHSITDGDTDKNGDSFNGLGDPYGINTVHIDTQTYALVTSLNDHGIQIINITDPENPLATHSIIDDTVDSNGNTFETLADPAAVAIATIGTKIYAVIPSYEEDAIQIIYLQYISEDSPIETKSKGSGCADCIPPTLGLNTNYKRIVDNGFSYNNNPVQVKKWHTPYPLINATVGEMNTVEVIIYENQGIYNIRMVQFGLGLPEVGMPRNDLEVLIIVPLFKNYTSGYMETDELTIRDKDNLIEDSTVNATANVTSCGATTSSCLKVALQYSYRESTINNMMLVSVTDRPGNTQNFYFNEGVKVFGESQNPVPYYTIQNRKTHQQTENLEIVLFREDKVKNIWIDGMGIKYLQVSSDRFDRITPAEPYQCTDPPLDEINVPTRSNCHFRALTTIWDY